MGLTGETFPGDRLVKAKIMKQAEQRLSGELFRLIHGLRKRIDDVAAGTRLLGLVEMIEQPLLLSTSRNLLQNTYPGDYEQGWANACKIRQPRG